MTCPVCQHAVKLVGMEQISVAEPTDRRPFAVPTRDAMNGVNWSARFASRVECGCPGRMSVYMTLMHMVLEEPTSVVFEELRGPGVRGEPGEPRTC